MVSEQKKTEQRDFRFWPREKWIVPRSLLRNRTEMVATQAILNRLSNFIYTLVWLVCTKNSKSPRPRTARQTEDCANFRIVMRRLPQY